MADMELQWAEVQKRAQKSERRNAEMEQQLLWTQGDIEAAKNRLIEKEEHHQRELSTVKITAAGTHQNRHCRYSCHSMMSR